MLRKLRYFNWVFGDAIFLKALEKITLSEFVLISLYITWKEHNFVFKNSMQQESRKTALSVLQRLVLCFWTN